MNKSNNWKDIENEKSGTQKFWLGLLRDSLGLDEPERYINFEKPVELSHVSYIDAYIPSTGIIIEQKSADINLDSSFKQSDGTSATPFEQAKRYYDGLPLSQKGRYIVICNFREIRIHDMETPKAPPEVILTDNLNRESNRLKFLIDPNAQSPKDIRELEISVKAGELVGKLYDSLLERYVNPNDKHSQRCLNIFCVRIVFLLYAEDSKLFHKSQFHDYLKARELTARDALRKLFDVLSQKENERDPYLEDDLMNFPYVNGGLFAEKDIEIPKLDGEPLRIILEEMSEGFDWKDISPTIFGAAFESTLNPETRKTGGMHYTSIENIHKVIDPLFLDELTEEANEIINSQESSSRTKKLREFQKRISRITFFDPACGSGNFLTESYLSLRRLENRIISELTHGQKSFAFSKEETPVQISISQFYGIEINDFAVSVARTALWIAEAQMWNETASIVELYDDPLPLKSFNHIIEDNALRIDWKTILPSEGKIYIMGNPPFMGYSVQTKQQKEDILSVFVDENGKTYKSAGKVDYVSGWYFKASKLVQDKRIKAAFVSTNSITQGEQVSAVFKTLHERFGIEIDFAHQSFVWDSEAQEKAHVHVVVIGFDTLKEEGRMRRLYTPEGLMLTENINFYLVPASNVFAEARTKALCPDAHTMMLGNLPRDGGNLLINSQEEYEEFIRKEPKAERYIKKYLGAEEFINNVNRYCLWLVDISPQELMSMPRVMERIKAVREFRLASTREATRKLADTSWLFAERRQPSTNYIAIPLTSSEKRKYIPIDWLPPEVITSNAISIIPNATLYDFGVLTSRIHMEWVRSVCGRLEMRYRYSNTIVYNNFIWPCPTPKQRSRIESTAQMILDARALYPESSFAALYNDVLMPPELRRAHEQNDDAVCEAYGWQKDISGYDIAAKLFVLYDELTHKKVS